MAFSDPAIVLPGQLRLGHAKFFRATAGKHGRYEGNQRVRNGVCRISLFRDFLAKQRNRGTCVGGGAALFMVAGVVLVGDPNQLLRAAFSGFFCRCPGPSGGRRPVPFYKASLLLLLCYGLVGGNNCYRPVVAASDRS